MSIVLPARRKIAAHADLDSGIDRLCASRIRRVTFAFQRFSARAATMHLARRVITNCRQACRCRVCVCVFACTSFGHHNRRACTIVLSAIDFGKHRLVRSSMPSTREMDRFLPLAQLGAKRCALSRKFDRFFFRSDNYSD